MSSLKLRLLFSIFILVHILLVLKPQLMKFGYEQNFISFSVVLSVSHFLFFYLRSISNLSTSFIFLNVGFIFLFFTVALKCQCSCWIVLVCLSISLRWYPLEYCRLASHLIKCSYAFILVLSKENSLILLKTGVSLLPTHFFFSLLDHFMCPMIFPICFVLLEICVCSILLCNL